MEGVSYASTILKRAVALDSDKKYTESLVCYQEGIQILLEALKKLSEDDTRKDAIRGKVQEYMGRAEIVKKLIEKLKKEGGYREQWHIEEDATDYSYDKIFSRFLDLTVKRVEIDDPYIRSPHQCDNFLRFIELCLRQCPSLLRITLTTKTDKENHSDQRQRLSSIAKSVQKVTLGRLTVHMEYSDSLHDREIRLDNGWIIKIGRGLDYFKPVDRYCVGWTDYKFRPCRATTVDIFHRNELAQ